MNTGDMFILTIVFSEYNNCKEMVYIKYNNPNTENFSSKYDPFLKLTKMTPQTVKEK